jgi:hypothetical protein
MCSFPPNKFHSKFLRGGKENVAQKFKKEEKPVKVFVD